MRIRVSVVTAVYRKSLKLSNKSRQLQTVGEITNLMSVDASRIAELCNYGHILWSGPFQIVVALYFLYDTMGPSIFAGVAIMVSMIPLNAFLATRSRKLNKEQMANKDTRTKLMDEVLSGMKVIKLYAWEVPFFDKITKAREMELETLRKIGILSAAQSFTWSCTPFLVSFSTFAFYSFLHPEVPLTSTKIFVALVLFNLLQFPLAMFPNVIAAAVEASVSFRRLFKFLTAEEIDDSNVKRLLVSPTFAPEPPNKDKDLQIIEISHGSFSWEAPTQASTSSPQQQGETEPLLTNAVSPPRKVLTDISLNVPDGCCLAVVGQVGSGKSSLLSAILGDTYKMSGSVTVRGRIAYVSSLLFNI